MAMRPDWRSMTREQAVRAAYSEGWYACGIDEGYPYDKDAPGGEPVLPMTVDEVVEWLVAPDEREAR